MKRYLFPIAALLLLGTALPSCKKDDKKPTRSEQIVGTWTETFEAVDDNGNNTLDESERTNIPATDASTISFSSDGKGQMTVSGMQLPMNWKLIDNEERLVVDIGFGTDTLKIYSFDGKLAVLESVEQNKKNWSGYTKN